MEPMAVTGANEPVFEKIYLEISNICNLQCSFCPPVKRANAVLPANHFRSYLQSIKGYSRRVCLHVMGEPLGHKQFPLFVEVAAEMGVALEITTNGTLLNQSNQQALMNPSVVQVNFSVQSFFDNFPTADPNRYIESLFSFCREAMIQRPDLYINFRLWNLESDQENQAANNNFLKAIEKEFHVELNPKVDPAFKKSKKISGRIYLHFDSRFEWPEESSLEPRTKGTCYGSRTHIAVHANGDVVPCCLDKEAQILLGNLSEQPFSEILNSKRFLNIRQGFERGQLVELLCQTCQYSTRFGKSLKT
ncbi:MAG: radical SAM/SPASM domain-containing protein [Bdellovibrionales bacterium]|nr:radical SAM/SPASM domain-containing protein [Bdellovibrionales bacterium]